MILGLDESLREEHLQEILPLHAIHSAKAANHS
jgi:hypothetical protein